MLDSRVNVSFARGGVSFPDFISQVLRRRVAGERLSTIENIQGNSEEVGGLFSGAKEAAEKVRLEVAALTKVRAAGQK